MAAEIYAKIDQQCGWWETFSKIVPVASTLMFVLAWYISRDLSETLLVTGIAFLCITVTVWWFWAVRSIGHLARVNYHMLSRMSEIHQELTSARKELQEMQTNVKGIL